MFELYRGRMSPNMTTTTHAEAAALVLKAVEKIPELTRFGVGLGDDARRILRESGPDGLKQKVMEGQAELHASLEAVAVCADWIKQQVPIQSINTKHASYGYKHMVEGWCRRRNHPQYIPNGAFIAAAVGLGFKFRLFAESPNVQFNFSERTVKAMKTDEAVVASA